MKNICHLALVFSLLMLSAACSRAQTTDKTAQATVAEFEALVSENTEIQLLDVRRPEEFAEGMLAGSLNMNVLEEEQFMEQIKALDPQKPVAVYCRSGRRSMKAAEILEAQGFTRIYNLSGGILDWQEEGKAVEKQ